MIKSLINLRNYGFFNIDLANLLELKPAIYLQYLIIAESEASKKNKWIIDNYFRIQRSWITNETTITQDEQLLFDKCLQYLNIINICTDKDISGKANVLKINYDVINNLLNDPNAFALEDYKLSLHPLTPTDKPTKEEAFANNCMKYITTEDPTLRQAYWDWMDSICCKQGWISKAGVNAMQKEIDSYSHGDLNIALSLLQYAAVNGHRSAQWGAKYLNLSNNVNIIHNEIVTNTIELSDEVF